VSGCGEIETQSIDTCGESPTAEGKRKL